MIVLPGTDLYIIGVFIMAGLTNKEYYAFIIALIMIIAGIYFEKQFFYFLGFMIVAGLTGWVARGDSNGRQ